MSEAGARGATAPRPGSASPKGRRRRGSPTSVGAWPVAFIGLLMLGVAVFYYWPIVKNIITSFQQTNAFGGDPQFVGLDNYKSLFAEPEIGSAIGNTLLYTLILLIGVPLSVAIASMVELPGLRGKSVYRMIYFLPYLAMPMAVAQVWKVLYNGNFGLINQFLRVVGVDDPPYWIVTPGFAIVAVSVFGLWCSIGFNVIILSSGLKGIPRELYEAASIDGATGVKQFRWVTVPLLTPSIFFLSITTTIGGFQLFDALFAMIGRGNPAEPKTRSLVSLFYRQAFVDSNQGAGAATAIVILLFVAIVTVIQFIGQKKWVNYV
ncbi:MULTISPECIES: carbohydrate ABC transporter permease [Acidipropionibacterium]|jgi:multiple sugar transport system permease protein|uniref:sn-glycerol-3-phosphate transport system permease protein ugpA n=5 Tax=Acidipropionibacterium TaxID=1912215 RepID=A0A3S4YRK3_9ACTN|nr:MULTISPECIES: sugar ABC transporter permease [Acidipropionibacterium]AFV88701.1 ABC transporter, permease protein [Acidipropionibacterium acidipropionici ATCC 4875]MDN5976789.1 sugar ABC transporter permease [Acidipropionibacterium jensenii]MDN5996363.1 sugar ABC transporter permease [Acidipropionibacterium jensenii]MDN6512479.1 sugar ABC transporter permease [Acidipropionibacterium jensenii]MDN6792339.1 sugar ABC transporter permease [Acidipropionibacterium jensenii]